MGEQETSNSRVYINIGVSFVLAIVLAAMAYMIDPLTNKGVQ